MIQSGVALSDPLEPFTTGSFPVLQFNASQKPFVVDFSVPIPVDRAYRLWVGLVA
jgi:hypothetical protein